MVKATFGMTQEKREMRVPQVMTTGRAGIVRDFMGNG